MEQIAKAALLVEWFQPPPDVKNPEQIDLQYNPTELSWDKSAQLAEITIPGLDAPLQQFVRGQAERLTLELFFDTTDHGMGKGATERHHADGPDLSADQDRAQASCAADLHLLSGTTNFPAARSKAMPAAPQAARSAMRWVRRPARWLRP